MLEDADPGVHPLVHVTLEWQHHFRRRERRRVFHALQGLSAVELTVGHRQCVDVVQRLIAVDNIERLADLDAEHARRIRAALLIEYDRARRHRKFQTAQAVFYVHEYILESAVVGNYENGCRRSAELHAIRIRAHVDRRIRWRSALQSDDARDRAGGRRIDGVGRWRGSVGRRGFFAATAVTGGEDQRHAQRRDAREQAMSWMHR